MDITLTITDEQQAALENALARSNAARELRNTQINAQRELALLEGRPVDAMEQPLPLLTFQELVQLRLNERLDADTKEAARSISNELASTYLNATAEERTAMMQDMAKYRKTPTTTTATTKPTRPTR